jgi:hypothetical protein
MDSMFGLLGVAVILVVAICVGAILLYTNEQQKNNQSTYSYAILSGTGEFFIFIGATCLILILIVGLSLISKKRKTVDYSKPETYQ